MNTPKASRHYAAALSASLAYARVREAFKRRAILLRNDTPERDCAAIIARAMDLSPQTVRRYFRSKSARDLFT